MAATKRKVRIFRPARTAMQSGRAGTRRWVLEPEPAEPPRIDRLMGWTGSRDTGPQVQLRFDSREAAVAYARANGMEAEVIEPREPRPVIKSYADNFRTDRVG